MNEQLENLREIRSLMERSTKFMSLSGLSGIAAGVSALVGAFAGFQTLSKGGVYNANVVVFQENFLYLSFIAIATIALAAFSGIYFTVAKAKKQGLQVWNESSKNLILSFAIPFLTGGIFCLGLVYNGQFNLCFSAMLIFYGLAVVNTAKFTVRDVYYLGISEIILGLIALFLQKYNFLFWVLGFGVLHILYGTLMYYKYDRAKN